MKAARSEYLPVEAEPEKIRIPAGGGEHNPASRGWVKLQRGEDVEQLIKAAPLAFVLAAVIALRARFKAGLNPINKLSQGQCFLGDYRHYGMSLQQYRTAKAQLQKWGFATFKATSKGTIARLMDTRLFDVLYLPANKQGNKQPTNGQQAPNN